MDFDHLVKKDFGNMMRRERKYDEKRWEIHLNTKYSERSPCCRPHHQSFPFVFIITVSIIVGIIIVDIIIVIDHPIIAKESDKYLIP